MLCEHSVAFLPTWSRFCESVLGRIFPQKILKIEKMLIRIKISGSKRNSSKYSGQEKYPKILLETVS
jgi:hypothetical protein